MKKLILIFCSTWLFANVTQNFVEANATFEAQIKSLRALKDSKGEIVKEFSHNAFPISTVHKKVALKCTDCHLEASQKEYSSAMNESCKVCHGSYKKLAEATGGLGHNNNVHASPHYEDLDCDNCHKQHTKPQNLCLTCHSQQAMRELVVK